MFRSYLVNALILMQVKIPYVGGAFGGKGCVQLEFIVYLTSRAVGDRMVNLVNSREEDLISSLRT